MIPHVTQFENSTPNVSVETLKPKAVNRDRLYEASKPVVENARRVQNFAKHILNPGYKSDFKVKMYQQIVENEEEYLNKITLPENLSAQERSLLNAVIDHINHLTNRFKRGVNKDCNLTTTCVIEPHHLDAARKLREELDILVLEFDQLEKPVQAAPIFSVEKTVNAESLPARNCKDLINRSVNKILEHLSRIADDDEAQTNPNFRNKELRLIEHVLTNEFTLSEDLAFLSEDEQIDIETLIEVIGSTLDYFKMIFNRNNEQYSKNLQKINELNISLQGFTRREINEKKLQIALIKKNNLAFDENIKLCCKTAIESIQGYLRKFLGNKKSASTKLATDTKKPHLATDNSKPVSAFEAYKNKIQSALESAIKYSTVFINAKSLDEQYITFETIMSCLTQLPKINKDDEATSGDEKEFLKIISEMIIGVIAEFCKEVHKQSREIVFVPSLTQDRIEAAHDLHESLEDLRVLFEASPEEVIKAYKEEIEDSKP